MWKIYLTVIFKHFWKCTPEMYPLVPLFRFLNTLLANLFSLFFSYRYVHVTTVLWWINITKIIYLSYTFISVLREFHQTLKTLTAYYCSLLSLRRSVVNVIKALHFWLKNHGIWKLYLFIYFNVIIFYWNSYVCMYLFIYFKIILF